MRRGAGWYPGAAQVSILVFVELALDGIWARQHLPSHKVSILVFVELALDEPGRLIRKSLPKGFNPCFRGTCSWCEKHDLRACLALVSILVFVELALDAFPGSSSNARIGVSILVFVELALDAFPPEAASPRSAVSILVFVELALDVRPPIWSQRAS